MYNYKSFTKKTDLSQEAYILRLALDSNVAKYNLSTDDSEKKALVKACVDQVRMLEDIEQEILNSTRYND